MGLSFLFGSYARTVGVGDTTVQWCCPLPRKPRQVYHNLVYNINKKIHCWLNSYLLEARGKRLFVRSLFGDRASVCVDMVYSRD